MVREVVARAAALSAGLFLAYGVVALLTSPRLDTAVWLVDLRWLPVSARVPLMLAIAASLIGFALAARHSRGFRVAAAAASMTLAGVALLDCLRFWWLLSTSAIVSQAPVPASLLVAVTALFIAWAAGRETPVRRPSRLATLAGAAALGSVFPVLHMFCFGLTDYRRPADAVLVFGARAYADGTPSDALADRVLAACDLYRRGLAHTLILSGGPGDGEIHETESMRRLAVARGVPAQAIVLDRRGTDTRASVQNAAQICAAKGFTRVLAVSHFYHLPRIKIEGNRAGLTLFTSPADQRGRALRALPYFMAREAVAWWWSSFRFV